MNDVVRASRPLSSADETSAPLLLGILPLAFFLLHLSTHLEQGTPANMLWMCNISNLVLAIGIFFRLPALIRISALWLIPGVPLWLYDMNRTGYDPTTTFFPHIGGTLVGLYALYCVKGRSHMWIYAWVYGLIVQVLCRFLTPRELNVNVAFDVYPPLEKFFSHYWTYWIFNAVIAALGLWLLCIVLNALLAWAEAHLIPKAGKMPAVQNETARNH